VNIGHYWSVGVAANRRAFSCALASFRWMVNIGQYESTLIRPPRYRRAVSRPRRASTEWLRFFGARPRGGEQGNYQGVLSVSSRSTSCVPEAEVLRVRLVRFVVHVDSTPKAFLKKAYCTRNCP